MAKSPRSWIVGCIRQRDGASIAKSPRQSDCRLRSQACPDVPLKPKWTARMMAAPVGVPRRSVLDERAALVTVGPSTSRGHWTWTYRRPDAPAHRAADAAVPTRCASADD